MPVSDTVIIEAFKLGSGFILAAIMAYFMREQNKQHRIELIKIIDEQGKRNERLTTVLEATQMAVRDMQEIVRDLIQHNEIKDIISNRPGRVRK